MPKVLIGCPVARRAWVLPQWFAHVRAACEQAEVTPGFIFVCPLWDRETIQALDEGAVGSQYDILTLEEPPLPPQRSWTAGRIQHMVELRNRLLAGVRSRSPDLFWSLDSDVLPSPRALQIAMNVLHEKPCEAVGMHLYLSEIGRHHGSKAILSPSTGRMALRQVHDSELKSTFPVDVVMASVLMTPKAYQVDYQYHVEGEDIGWSISCKDRGLRLYWAGEALCKHVMSPKMLGTVDPRVGW